MGTPLTGGKVFAIIASAFAVIIGVNLFMAVTAVRTFPGLEVKNSYVASQVFDRERLAQEKLGWTMTHSYAEGALRLSFRDADGLPVAVDRISALVGRPTSAAADTEAQFQHAGGDYIAPLDLDPGKWMILLEAIAPDGTRFHQRFDLMVKEGA